jgi:Protein of unknown function (DUF4230)
MHHGADFRDFLVSVAVFKCCPEIRASGGMQIPMSTRRSGGVMRTLILTTGVVVAVIAIGIPMAWKWLGSSLSTKTIDRSAPTVLASLKDLSEYNAATGEFEQLVDIEKDVPWLPSAIAGERVLFIGVGSVNAYVDFSQLDEDALEFSDDGKSVTVTLPEPRLGDAVIDTERSEVANRDRGVLDRLAGVFEDNPTSEKELYLIAEERIAAAAEDSELRSKARENTSEMLTGLIQGLGVENVVVRYDNDILPDTPPAA